MKKIFLVVTISLLSFSTFASHIIGGEISYKCLGGNLYEFTAKIYRDCFNGIPPLDAPAYFTIFNASNQVVWNDTVTLLTDSILPLYSPDPCLDVPPNICVEEGTYIFTAVLPPSNGGYILAYQRCCRNNSILNLDQPGNQGATYVVELNDAVLSMCNNSPYFVNYPPIVICAGHHLIFDHSAFDPDGDSLVYELCQPYNGATGTNSQPPTAAPPPYIGINYLPPYTAANPMDGNPALAINPVTGLLTVTPTVVGQFVVGICVKEYRNGVYLGTHLRDFQFNVVDCQPTVVSAIPSLINNCSGFSFVFQNFSTGPITHYHWDFGIPGVTDDTSNQHFPAFTYSDTGIYTITLEVYSASGCADTQTAVVYVYPNLFALMSAQDGCTNTPLNFLDLSTSTYGDINSWLWSFGDGDTSHQQNPTHTYTASGTYTVQLIVGTANGCADTVSQSIDIYQNPDIIIHPRDTTVIYGVSLPLSVQGGAVYSWSPVDGLSDPNIANPICTPQQTTTYYITITTSNGCIILDSLVVNVVLEPVINIPNAFTPNNNGSNDFFRPLIIGVIAQADFRIYNRWGQLIYQTKNAYNSGWDGTFNGTPQEVGVYVYTFDCIGAKTGTPYHFKGNVTLLR